MDGQLDISVKVAIRNKMNMSMKELIDQALSSILIRINLCQYAHCSIKITRQVYFSFMNSFRQNTKCSQTKQVFNSDVLTFISISKKSNAAIEKNNDMQKCNNCVQCYANCLQINYAAKAASAYGVTTLTVSHQIGLEAECAGNYLDKLL